MCLEKSPVAVPRQIFLRDGGWEGRASPHFVQQGVGSGLWQESGRGDAIGVRTLGGALSFASGVQAGRCPRVPLPGQWELAQEATLGELQE